MPDYVSDAVIANLEKAILEYCPKLVEKGILNTCDRSEDPPFPEPNRPRKWTKWATGNDDYSSGNLIFREKLAF